MLLRIHQEALTFYVLKIQQSKLRENRSDASEASGGALCGI